MIRRSIEKLSKEIGYDIGSSDDVVQSDMLTGFCHAIHDSMQEQDRNMQLCYIAKHLDKKSYNILKGIVEFVELKQEEK
jgi:hypothetical protein